MRAAIDICCLLCGFALYFIITPSRVCFADRYPAVQQCTTLDEIKTVLGCEPGRHARTDVGYLSPVYYPPNSSRDIKSWVADDCCIYVLARSKGTVVATWIAYSDDHFWWGPYAGASIGVAIVLLILRRALFPRGAAELPDHAIDK